MAAFNIHQVLADMQKAGDQAFQIEFIVSTGKEQGEVRKRLCYFGAPNPKDRQKPTATQQGREQRKTNLESGTVPLTEAGTRRMQTPRIDHIIGFRSQKVYH